MLEYWYIERGLLGKSLTLTASLSSLHPGVQMGTAQFNAGGSPTRKGGGGGRNVPSRFIPQKTPALLVCRLNVPYRFEIVYRCYMIISEY